MSWSLVRCSTIYLCNWGIKNGQSDVLSDKVWVTPQNQRTTIYYQTFSQQLRNPWRISIQCTPFQKILWETGLLLSWAHFPCHLNTQSHRGLGHTLHDPPWFCNQDEPSIHKLELHHSFQLYVDVFCYSLVDVDDHCHLSGLKKLFQMPVWFSQESCLFPSYLDQWMYQGTCDKNDQVWVKLSCYPAGKGDVHLKNIPFQLHTMHTRDRHLAYIVTIHSAHKINYDINRQWLLYIFTLCHLLESFSRMQFPETIEVLNRRLFSLLLHSLHRTCHGVKCHKALWLQVHEAVWSNTANQVYRDFPM